MAFSFRIKFAWLRDKAAVYCYCLRLTTLLIALVLYNLIVISHILGIVHSLVIEISRIVECNQIICIHTPSNIE